ncbi:unnamed protein product [Rotaria socialis]|uniref:Uncharacterized protein n=1 Tax=Rotaria socialis TaxID=392032 RepID=A0A818LVI4_9BILA|nr:unnamed protein product [Rotaria socialis]
MDTSTNLTTSKDESESIIVINDDANGPPFIKEFFSKLSTNIEKNRWTGSCNVCSLSITSNILKRVKIKHRLIFDEWKSKQDQVVQETNQPKTTIAHNRDNEKYVDPKYNMINRRDITRNFLPVMYKSCIKKLQEVCNRSNYIGLTLDAWSDRRMRSYFGVTLHAIVDDHYKTYLLSFERLTGKHSGEKLAAEFDRVTQLYNLKDKLVRIITDNASNNQATFNHLLLPGFDEYFDDSIDDQSELETSDDDTDSDECDKNQLEIEEVNDDIYGPTRNAPTDQEFLRLPCFIHSLQLVVHDGIKAASGALSSLKKVADLAKLAHTSTSFAERLRDIIIVFLELIILNTKDRKTLEDFVSLFELFNEATILTQVISSIKARFNGLLRHFEIDVPFASYSMSERFSDPIFLVTPVLDARFKFLWLDSLQGTIERIVLHTLCTFLADSMIQRSQLEAKS